jgi:hypothetical protein
MPHRHSAWYCGAFCVTPPSSLRRFACDEHRARPGAAGERGDALAEQFRRLRVNHAGDGVLVDLAGRFRRHHEARARLAQLDLVRHFHHAVQHAEACVAEVEDGGVRVQIQLVRDGARGGRFVLLAAHAGVDEHVHFVGGHVGRGECLLRRRRRALGKPVARFPPAPLVDPGEQLELPRTHLERFINRREPRLQFRGGNHHRRKLVADRLDVNAVVIHAEFGTSGVRGE